MFRHFLAAALTLILSKTTYAGSSYVPPVRTKMTFAEVLKREELRKENFRRPFQSGLAKSKGRNFDWYAGVFKVGEIFEGNIAPNPTNFHWLLGSCTLSGSAHAEVLTDTCSGSDMYYHSCDYTIRITPVSNQNAMTTMTCTAFLKDQDDNWVPTTPLQHIVRWTEYIPKKCPRCSAMAQGSDISVDGQSMSERIPVVGTGFDLVYSSALAAQYKGQGDGLRQANFRANGVTVSIQHRYDSTKKLLYRGDGGVVQADYTTLANGDLAVASADGSEVFVFSPSGFHHETYYGLTGATKFLFAYETDGQLASISDDLGNVTHFWKDTYGNLSSIQAPRGQTTYVTLESSSLLVTAVTNPASQTYHLSYYQYPDGSYKELLHTFQKPGGQITTFNYDDFGRLIQDLGYGGNSWNISSDPLLANQPITKTSNLGRVTSYTIEDSGGVYTRTQTDSTGLATNFSEEDGSVWTENSYKGWGSLLVPDERLGSNVLRPTLSGVVMANGTGSVESDTSYTQTILGLVDAFHFTSITKQATTSGRTTTEVYTAANKTFVTTTPQGATRTKVINDYERPTSLQIGTDTPWTFTYDTYGRLSVTDQGGYNTLTNTYNSNGYLQKIKNVRNEETSFTYDGAGRVLTTTLPDLRVITYSYDNNGNLTSVTPPSRPIHSFGFNAMELLGSYTPPTLSGVTPTNTTYNYNNDRQLTSVVRPDGKTLSYTYDATTGLLTAINWSGVGMNYYYIANTPLIDHINSRDGVTSTFTYYGDLVKTESQSNTSSGFLYGKITYNYDTDHRRTSREVRGNAASPVTTISTTYNNDDKPTQVGNLNITYSYPSGRVSTTTLDNISDSRTYDARGLLATYTATYTPTSTVLYTYTLTRDLGGRITGKNETIQGVTSTYVYGYDTAGRLTSVTKNGAAYSSYVYDNNSNRTSGVHAGTAFTATYNDQDWLLTWNATVYSYNNNGDLTNIQYNATTSKAMVYDAFSNLKSVTVNPGSLAYTYNLDGQHNRVSKSGVGRYLYENPFQMVAQVNSSGVVQKHWIYATSVNSPDYMINSSGTRYRFVKDHLGSPRLIVNSSTGAIAQRMDYTDLGKVTNNTNASMQPFGFAGGIYDSDTGFVHFVARDYDPETGRWLSKDPIRFAGGDTNLFGYVLNDPINLRDSNGKCPLCAAVAIGAIVGATANVVGSAIAGTLTTDNVIQTAGIGATAGTLAVLTSGAVAASAAAATLGELLTADLSAGFASTIMATGVDILGNILLSSPPSADGYKGIETIKNGPNCDGAKSGVYKGTLKFGPGGWE